MTPRSEEVTLYDANGEAVAYIAPSEDLTIYLWDGNPVAYLVRDGDAFSIYGFNGAHLGWFEGGVVRDHEGDAVGFVKGAVSMITCLEPLKSLKELKPLKSLRELVPLKPAYSRRCSVMPSAYSWLLGQSDVPQRSCPPTAWKWDQCEIHHERTVKLT